MDPKLQGIVHCTGANKQQTANNKQQTTNNRPSWPTSTISASTTSTNIFCPFLFSDVHSTPILPYRLAGPSCTRPWQTSGKSFAMLETSEIGVALLIPSERSVSRFLFTNLHPVCLHSELKSYLRRYILFPVLNTLPLFPNCSRIIDKQVV